MLELCLTAAAKAPFWTKLGQILFATNITARLTAHDCPRRPNDFASLFKWGDDWNTLKVIKWAASSRSRPYLVLVGGRIVWTVPHVVTLLAPQGFSQLWKFWKPQNTGGWMARNSRNTCDHTSITTKNDWSFSSTCHLGKPLGLLSFDHWDGHLGASGSTYQRKSPKGL